MFIEIFVLHLMCITKSHILKNTSAFISIFLLPLIFLGQERFLTHTSKDSVNGEPRFKGSIGANLKLNGYYDLFGGLQENETFNVGLIDVFGTDDSQSFHMDLYQSQIKLESTYIEKGGEHVYAVVEFDFWGGNGHMRLRKAFIESRHWQIGQNWNNFGDEVLWPNIMEWEGPPSGVWVRSPHIKYINTFKNEAWIYEASLEAPIIDYIALPELDLPFEEAYQVTPDLTFALKKRYGWGHIRLSSILRNIRYEYENEIDNYIGYGFSLTGIYANARKNNFQFQFVAGEGIVAYLTSLQGLGYDGYIADNNKVKPTPAFGGWASYEYFFTRKFHANAVVGITRYNFNNIKEFVVNEQLENQEFVVQGDFFNTHYYGIFNLMYEPFERMTIGLELDYGVKNILLDGYINGDFSDIEKSRDAMRISFGFMFYL
jgi:hypothetical protein